MGTKKKGGERGKRYQRCGQRDEKKNPPYWSGKGGLTSLNHQVRQKRGGRKELMEAPPFQREKTIPARGKN